MGNRDWSAGRHEPVFSQENKGPYNKCTLLVLYRCGWVGGWVEKLIFYSSVWSTTSRLHGCVQEVLHTCTSLVSGSHLLIRESLWNTPVTFWTLDEIKNSSHGKGKREDLTGRKREKVGQLCPNTERGAVQGWTRVASRCQLHRFNQAINNCIISWNNSPIKKRHRIGSYQ